VIHAGCRLRRLAVEASDWVALVIAGFGILGTLAAITLAQRGEAKRAERSEALEATRREQDRRDALHRERREAIRADYLEVLQFVAATRLFVSEMRSRVQNLEWVTEHYSSDAREVEDLEARAAMLRRRFLDELPHVQALVGVWGSAPLIRVFDEMAEFGPRISATMSVALHFKFQDERQDVALNEAITTMSDLLGLLERAQTVLQADPHPAGAPNPVVTANPAVDSGTEGLTDETE
jgi:hypothetical protein